MPRPVNLVDSSSACQRRGIPDARAAVLSPMVPSRGKSRMSAAGPDSVVPRAGSAGDRLADGGAGPLRLMAVHAHPDDESSKGAATMARYVREGVEVLVCTLTGGERGDILNKAMDQPEVRANLPLIRREEMAKARDILGVRQQFLGFVDSGLPEGDPLPPLPDGCFALQPLEVAAKPLVKAAPEVNPHVMLTYDDNGGFPPPHHTLSHPRSVQRCAARRATRSSPRGAA